MSIPVDYLFTSFPPTAADALNPGLKESVSTSETVKLVSETLDALFQMLSSHNNRVIGIATLDGSHVELTTASIEPYGSNGLLWYGVTPHLPGVEAHLTVIADPDNTGHYQIAGRLLLPDGGRLLIQPGGTGYAHLSIMSPPAREMFASVKPIVQLDNSAFELQSHPEDVLPQDAESTPAVIQILPAYSPSTFKALGNDITVIKAVIGDWQNTTNRIFQNSGIAARVEILSTPLILPEPQTNKVSELLYETLAGGGLYKNRAPGSLWSTVKQERDTTKSDLVLLLAADWSGSVVGESGSIPLPPRLDKADELEQCVLSFCPKKVGGVDIGQIFAHELGHLLGGMHDIETDMMDGHHYTAPPMFDYVCGYQDKDRSFMTTLGYARESEIWILYYSAANQTWLNPKTGQRKPVGIAVGQPDAADAAAFFRASTKTVAQYRGGAKVQFRSLSFDVNPTLGGTVLPTTFGPYIDGSSQTVRAIARTGYTFEHWELDGRPAGSDLQLSVRMDGDHQVRAMFTEGLKHPRLITAVEGLSGGLQASIKAIPLDHSSQEVQPTAPEFTSGSEVQIDCTIAQEILSKYEFLGWRINGSSGLVKGHQYKSNFKGEWQVYRLIVRVEQDINASIVFKEKTS